MPTYVEAANGKGYWQDATADSLQTYPLDVDELLPPSEEPSAVPSERSRGPWSRAKEHRKPFMEAQEVVVPAAFAGIEDEPGINPVLISGRKGPLIASVRKAASGTSFDLLLDKLAEQVDALQGTAKRLREEQLAIRPGRERLGNGMSAVAGESCGKPDVVHDPGAVVSSRSLGKKKTLSNSLQLGAMPPPKELAKRRALSFTKSTQFGDSSCPASVRQEQRKVSDMTNITKTSAIPSVQGSEVRCSSQLDMVGPMGGHVNHAARAVFDLDSSKPLVGAVDEASSAAGSERGDPLDVMPDEDQFSTMFVELHDQWEHVHHRLKGQMTLGFDIFQKSSHVHDRGFYLGHKSLMQRLVVEPSSDFCLYWVLVEMFLLLYDVITIPTMVFNPPENWVNTTITWIGVIFRTLDVPVSCMQGYVTRRGDLEMKLKKVVLHYFRTHFFLDFLLLAIEWLSFVVATFGVGGDLSDFERFVKLVRFCRLLKVAKFRRISSSCLKRVRSNVVLALLAMTRGLVIVLIIMHYAACGFYAIGDWDIHENRWITDDFKSRGFFFRYTTCVMWSFTHMGLGTLDIEPSNALEGAYSNIVTLLGLIAFSHTVGNVVIGLTRLQTLNQSCREQEDFLRDFMAKYRVSWPLRNRIWSFLKKSSDGGKIVMAEKRVELIRNLPRSMALELRAEVYIPVLTVHPFFNMYSVSQADKSAMYSLMEAQAVIAKTLQAEHELFVERQPALAMHFVVSGVMTYTQVISSESLQIFGFTSSREIASPKSLFPDTMNKRISFLAEGFSMAEVRHGTWLCEHALWLNWRYMGMAVAETRCELVGVDADKFRNIMASTLPEAQRYAKEYVRLVEARKEVMNDVWMDLGAIKRVAQDIFEPPLSFDIKKCRPASNAAQGLSEWKPADRRAWQRLWTSPWQDCHLYNRSALIATMTTEMKYDVIMMFHTLFAQNSEAAADIPWISVEEKFLHDQRVLFLKRLILCLAVCGVSFCTEDNGQHTLPWRYPLASIFCHGGRTLLRLVDVQWKEVVNFLFYGDEHGWQWDESGPPPPLYTRRAATHGVRLDCRTTSLEEVKLRGTSTIGRGHFGMDMPLGGVGNPAPPHKSGQLYVGPSGVPFKKGRRQKNAQAYAKEYQHGHLYLRHDEFSERYLPLLSPLAPASGVEPKEPVRKNRRSLTVMSRRPTRILTSTSVVSGGHNSARRGFCSDRMAAGLFQSENDTVWTTLKDIATPQALDCYLQRMPSFTSADMTYQMRTLNMLHHFSETQRELRVEVADNQMVRCKGMLIFLVIQLEEADGTHKVLVHQGARLTSSNSEAITEEPNGLQLELSFSGYIEDIRVVTIRSRHNEPWVAAVASYCQKVFRLTDEAIEKLLGGCQEGVDSSYWFTCRAPPTMCKNHTTACSTLVPLEYNALRVKAVISEKDKHLFTPILGKEFKTYEAAETLPELHERGLGEQSRAMSDSTSEMEISVSEPVSTGMRKSSLRPLVGGQKVIRSWHWIGRDSPERVRGTVGLDRPPNAKPLRLCKYKQKVGSILFGVESSAPLKEDLFGNSHNPDGASKEVSAFGKRKWRDFRQGGEMAPADLGGLRACLTAGRFRQFQELCADLTLCRPSDGYLPDDHNQDVEKRLFMDLLESSSIEAQEVLSARCGLRQTSIRDAEVFAADLFGDLLNDDAA